MVDSGIEFIDEYIIKKETKKPIQWDEHDWKCPTCGNESIDKFDDECVQCETKFYWKGERK